MKKLIILSMLAGLGGCGASINDLVAYTSEVKQNTHVNIETYPEFRQIDAVSYDAKSLRSPFMRFTQSQQALVPAQQVNCPQPNHQRSKQKLEAYGIDSLQMAGVFSDGKQQWVLIKANDGSLHKAKKGQFIGLFHGRIEQIHHTEIVIQEMLPDGTGCWKSKTTSLSMAGANQENNNV